MAIPSVLDHLKPALYDRGLNDQQINDLWAKSEKEQAATPAGLFSTPSSGNVFKDIGQGLLRGAAGSAASSIFGAPNTSEIMKPLRSFTPIGLNAPGLNLNFSGDNANLARSPGTQGLLDQAGTQTGQYVTSLDDLLSQVKPGFGKLTESAVNTLRDNQRSTVGNLRENLARRRVAGSSFATDAISRSDAEFAKQEADVRSRAFLEEMDVTSQLLERKNTATINNVAMNINQMNFETGIAAQLTQTATEALRANAEVQSRLLAEEAANKGDFFAGPISDIADAAGGVVDLITGKAGDAIGNIVEGGVSNAVDSMFGNSGGTGALPDILGAGGLAAAASPSALAAGAMGAGGLAAGAAPMFAGAPLEGLSATGTTGTFAGAPASLDLGMSGTSAGMAAPAAAPAASSTLGADLAAAAPAVAALAALYFAPRILQKMGHFAKDSRQEAKKNVNQIATYYGMNDLSSGYAMSDWIMNKATKSELRNLGAMMRASVVGMSKVSSKGKYINPGATGTPEQTQLQGMLKTFLETGQGDMNAMGELSKKIMDSMPPAKEPTIQDIKSGKVSRGTW